MHHILKSFFYSVALLTLFWMSQTPAEAINFTAWVKVLQSPYAQQTAAVLTIFIETFDGIVACLLRVPVMMCTKVVHYMPVSREGSPSAARSETGLG